MSCALRRFLTLLLLVSLGHGPASADSTVASADAAGAGSDEQRLVIVFASANEGEPVFRMAENLLAELGRRMAVKIELISLPVERGAHSLENGRIDAELSRILEFGKTRPELIRVEETIARVAYHAYATKPYTDLNGWNSLKPYRIVHRMGLQFVKEYLGEMNVQAVNSTEAGLAFMLRDRADVYIETPPLVEPLLQTHPEFSEIRRIDPAIAWFDTYTYFAPDHTVMAERYLQALRSMKVDGSYQKLMQLPQEPQP
ncbi:transporter substrate-binding domain-containing protein [Allohahella marinimesophila]|uniref:Uncharacterized protein n=1 Tax=Allohahella marinimesophila TaxID=1054972 RepID=A0ABP7PF43_9GAMM